MIVPAATFASIGADEVCEALCQVLRYGVDLHRGQAAQALGRIGHRGAVETLIGALLDEDPDVRTDAADALARLADGSAGEQLLENLIGDPCADVKLAAIEGFARMRWRDAVPWLRRLVKGRDEEIAWDEGEYFEAEWDSWADIQVKAIEALAELGVVDAVPEIVDAIEDDDGQDLTELAFRALARLKEPGIAALIAFQRDANERRRRRAAAILGGLAGSTAVDDAVKLALGDPSVDVRLAAARSMAANRPSDPRLEILFGDGEPEVRAEAVRLCGREHPERMDTLLDDDAEAVQAAVLDAIADRPDLPPGIEIADRISTLLDAPSPRLAASAAAAFAAAAPAEAVGALTLRLADTNRPVEVRIAAIRGLAAVGGDVSMRALIEILGDKRRQVRMEAIAGLAAMARSSAWPNPAGEALLSALRGELVSAPDTADMPDPQSEDAEDVEATAEEAVPTSTLESILSAGSTATAAVGATPEPAELTEEDRTNLQIAKQSRGKRRVSLEPDIPPHQDVPALAARVLGDLAQDVVAGALAEALGDGDREVRVTVADSLARIGERRGQLPDMVSEALLGVVPDGDREIRLAAIRALGASGDRSLAAGLTPLLQDDDSFVRTEAVRALSRLGEAATDFVALIDDPDPSVRLAVAEAVADAGNPKSVDRLVDFAFDFGGYHRRDAARILLRVDKAAANARFVDVLSDRERTKVWQVAIEALEELNKDAGRTA